MSRPINLLAPLCLLSVTLPAHAENWSDYRGPTGQGLYAGKGLPVEWSKTKNVAWNVLIPGKGWSSPIVWNGRVYLTSTIPVERGKDVLLEALCVAAADGKILWQTVVFRQDAKALEFTARTVTPALRP